MARVRNVAQRQQRPLQEAVCFADTDMGQMAKQITEIRLTLAQAEALLLDPVGMLAAAGGQCAAAGG